MTNIPNFLSSDNNYAPLVATTIASICDHTTSFCEFYVLDDNISDESKSKIEKLKEKFKNFSVDFIGVDTNLFSDFQLTVGISKAGYSRFLIPQLKQDIKKLLYIDVDIICLKDIAELYNIDLGHYSLGAVPEPFDKFQFNSKYHFNSGIMLINNEDFVKGNYIK